MGKVNKFDTKHNIPKVSLDKSGVRLGKSNTIVKYSSEKAVIIVGKSPSHPKGY